MRAPFTLEDILWKSICFHNTETILKHIDESSVIMINGKCLQKKELVDYFEGLKFAGYTINDMEVLFSERNIVQTVYDVRLTKMGEADTKTNANYRVSTTWLGDEDDNVEGNECLRFLYIIKNEI